MDVAKPPTSVRSIRLPDELWAELSHEAARRGISVNALVKDRVERLDRGWVKPEVQAPQTDADIYRKEAAAAIGALEFRVREGKKGIVESREHERTFGPVRAKPGSLLKGGKK